MTTIELTARLRLAADYIPTHGWTQGTMESSSGEVCLTGAIRNCAPQNGDEYIIRAVLGFRGRAEGWNDAADRTAEEVVNYLATAEVTDADLAEVFGSQWEAIISLVRTAATLTAEQTNALDAALGAAWDAALGAMWDAALDAVLDTVLDAALDAVWGAVRALAVRDLVGQHGFTQEHYDTLTGPWRTVVGRIHPDDADMKTTN